MKQSEMFKNYSAINLQTLKELKEEIQKYFIKNPDQLVADVNRFNILVDAIANDYIQTVESTAIICYNQIVDAENKLLDKG